MDPISVTFSELYTVAAFFINLLLLKLALLSRRPSLLPSSAATTTSRSSSRIQSIEDTCPSAGWAGVAEEEECAVCLSEFVRGEAVRELVCAHTFHKDCADKWLLAAGKVTCPLCRSTVVVPSEEYDVRPAAEGIDDADWGSQQLVLLLSKLRGGNVS